MNLSFQKKSFKVHEKAILYKRTSKSPLQATAIPRQQLTLFQSA